jgi:hypothetical protein
MKLGFHFLCFYAYLIGLLSFSTQEMPDTLMALPNEIITEDNNNPKKERQEKEFPKEKEEEDKSEDIEIEEEFSKQSPSLSTTTTPFNTLFFYEKKQSPLSYQISPNLFLQGHPPFYILFACLKIDFQLI